MSRGDDVKVTVLIENTVCREDIYAEHGLSLYIETDTRKILFDMGQSDLFLKNAERLHVDLSEVDSAILSHGHYDHGGGLGKFLEINKKASVYLSRYAFSRHLNATEKYIGLDVNLRNSERLNFTEDEPVKIGNMTLFSCNDKKRSFDLGSFGLCVMDNGKILPDDFRHEQYLLIEENGKKVLISGCSHKGILNIAEWFRPDVLIGGFHFSKLALSETLKSYAEYLDSFETVYYTCHCTGEEQYRFMKKSMKNLHYLSSGESVEI